MKLACGTDLVSIARMEKAIVQPRFVEKVFTEGEVAYCADKHSPAQHYAARFAAKEAVAKALGTGIAQGVSLTSIEVVHNEDGKPEVRLSGGAKARFEQMGGIQIELSLTHTDTDALAFVVLTYEG